MGSEDDNYNQYISYFNKLTKSEIMLSWTRFKHWLKSYPVIIILAQIHMKSRPKVKLCQVGLSSNIAQNNLSSLYEIISDH